MNRLHHWLSCIRRGSQRAPFLHLHVVNAAKGGAHHWVRKFPSVVGRNSNADIRLLDTMVSRQHCVILLGHKKVALRDLDSRNGTWVNGQPISETVLNVGDEIEIGTHKLKVVAAETSEAKQLADTAQPPAN